ncbi:MAG: uroporphyrinogen decarboxylase family protein [Ignisphaera sp.]|uniref:Uroporphyrinogen decarboxylase (URO-D) domain-containing protein n=1 Tax=Ignisphaera aggregans TaxID=334771 RepID=A0A7J3N0F9_9CREN
METRLGIEEVWRIHRLNFLKCARLEKPMFTPCRINLSQPILNIYREKIIEIINKYPLAFPDYDPEELRFDEESRDIYEDRYTVDVYGTIWRFRIKGFVGIPHRYPLEDLDRVREWSLPDPETGYPIGFADPRPLIPWEELFNYFDKLKERGRLIVFNLHHFLFQKLMDLVPLNKLIPALYRRDEGLLIALNKIAEYKLGLLKVVKRYRGIDVVVFLEDLGAQDSPLIKPHHLREYFLPYYRRFFNEVKSMNAVIYFHSDGNIVPLANVFLEMDVDVLNIQDSANGIDNIASLFRGKVCIDLNIDKEHLILNKSREEILNYIRNAVEKLETESSGLMINIEVYPPAPLEIIAYLAEACYRCCIERK